MAGRMVRGWHRPSGEYHGEWEQAPHGTGSGRGLPPPYLRLPRARRILNRLAVPQDSRSAARRAPPQHLSDIRGGGSVGVAVLVQQMGLE